MKKSLLFVGLITIMFIATAAYAGVTLRYYNKDSKEHTFPVTICGSHKTVTFGSSRTASVTIQGCDSATIKSSCGEINVSNGDKIEIKNGCIKKQ